MKKLGLINRFKIVLVLERFFRGNKRMNICMYRFHIKLYFIFLYFNICIYTLKSYNII